ncbi:MAG TPA: hypothetical protein EYH19_08920 [Desulfocapsa sulfexigens]|nr:hypothetical protein [Desulfocapsa sulfexigens]
MTENKLMRAYSQILQKAKAQLKTLEHKSWEELKTLIDKAEYKASELDALTAKELDQVRNDLKEDINLMAQYFQNLEQGVETFLEMDLPLLEKYLSEQALSLANPTELTILRLRMTAAMAIKEH